MNTVQDYGLLRSTGRALLDGLLVVVPIGAIILLVLGIVRRLQEAPIRWRAATCILRSRLW